MQAFVVDEEGFHHTLVGQHHITMETMGKEVTTVQTTRVSQINPFLLGEKQPFMELKYTFPMQITIRTRFKINYTKEKVSSISNKRNCGWKLKIPF